MVLSFNPASELRVLGDTWKAREFPTLLAVRYLPA
jgi:hypothetical protein